MSPYILCFLYMVMARSGSSTATYSLLTNSSTSKYYTHNHIEPVNKQLNFKKLYPQPQTACKQTAQPQHTVHSHLQPADKQLFFNILFMPRAACQQTAQPQYTVHSHIQPANKKLNPNILSMAMYSLPTNSSNSTYCQQPQILSTAMYSLPTNSSTSTYCLQSCTAC